MDKKIGYSILFSLLLVLGFLGLTKIVSSELDTTSNTNIVLYGDGVSNNTFTLGGSSEMVNLTVAVISTGSGANITDINITFQSGNFTRFDHFLSNADAAEYAINTSGTAAQGGSDETGAIFLLENITLWGGDSSVSGWTCANISSTIITCNGSGDNVLDPNGPVANRSLIIRFNVTAASNIEDRADWNISTHDGTNFNETILNSWVDGLAPRLFDVNITDGNVTRNNGTSLNFTELLDSESALTVRATVLDLNNRNGAMWLVYNGSDSGVLREPAVIGHDNSLANRGIIVEGSAVAGGIEHHVAGEVYTEAVTYEWTIPASATGSNISFQFFLNDTFNQAVTWNDSANGWGDGSVVNDEPFQLKTNESVIKMGQINLTVNSKNILNSPTLSTTYIAVGNATLEFEVKGFTIEGDTVLQLAYNDTGAMEIETNGVIKNNAGALNLTINGDNITTREGFLIHDQSVVYTTSIDLTGNNSNNFHFAIVMVGTDVNETAVEESDSTLYNYTAIAGPYQFTVDGTKPTITITGPTDNTVDVSSSTGIEYSCKSDDAGSGIKTFTWTLTKPNSEQVIQEVSASGTTVTKTFSGTDINRAGTYTVDCVGEDNVGNQGSGSSKTFTASFSTSASSGGGGGGSSTGTTTPTISFDVDFSEVTTGSIRAQQGLIKSFSFDGSTKHTITFDKVTATSATVTIASTPMTVTLNVGQTKEVDINLDGVNDVKVKLKSVVNGLADVEISKIEAGAQVVAKEEKAAAGILEAEPTPSSEPISQPVSRSNAGLWITLLVVLAVVVIGYLSYRKK